MSQNFTKNLPTPLPVNMGGTGSTAAPGALVNLGLGTPSGTGNVLLQTAPTVTRPNIVGMISGTAVAAGNVGEKFDTGILTGNYTGSFQNLGSFNLTAGFWLIYASVFYQSAAAGTSYVLGGISLVSANYVGPGDTSSFYNQADAGSGGISSNANSCFKPLNINATTPVYLTSNTVSSTGVSYTAQMIAIRMI